MIEESELVPIYFSQSSAEEIDRLLKAIGDGVDVENAVMSAVVILRYVVNRNNAGSKVELCVDGIPTVRIFSNGIEMYGDNVKGSAH